MEERRKDDFLLAKLIQKVDDHVARFERFEIAIGDRLQKHLDWAEAEKTALALRVSVVESVWRSIEKPVKIVGWAVTVFFAVLITSLATHLIEWLKSHGGK